jgi:type I restriction enzyme R subunit
MKNNAKSIRLDERHHVEAPLLDQLSGLGWEVIDLGQPAHPGHPVA